MSLALARRRRRFRAGELWLEEAVEDSLVVSVEDSVVDRELKECFSPEFRPAEDDDDVSKAWAIIDELRRKYRKRSLA